MPTGLTAVSVWQTKSLHGIKSGQFCSCWVGLCAFFNMKVCYNCPQKVTSSVRVLCAEADNIIRPTTVL